MRKAFLTIILVVILIAAFGAGFMLGLGEAEDTKARFGVANEAWNVISREYVDQSKVSAEGLSSGAIEGMIQALDDPYSAYLPPQKYKMTLSDLHGDFTGIGAYVDIKDEQFTIIAPIADSPAKKAGILAGDAVLEIDGESTKGMSTTEAIMLIRGTEGTPVRLLLRHEGEANPVEITVIRATIDIPSVTHEMRGDIAYIQISNFTSDTAAELQPTLEEITSEGATGIVLDLRYNPGGYLDTVVEVASFFIREGIVVRVISNQGEKSQLEVVDTKFHTDLLMIVLVNSHSASGSEVLSGALQDHTRAMIAGETTFGKGSVNIPHQLSDGSGIYLTIARWATPSGRLIEGKGIEPDINIHLEGEEAIDWAIAQLVQL
ncbi:S41 family peptidase [Chloroflexota bacterium]